MAGTHQQQRTPTTVKQPSAQMTAPARPHTTELQSYPATICEPLWEPSCGEAASDHAPCALVSCCTTTQQKTHGTELEVCYRWHPWFGRRVTLIRTLQKQAIDAVQVELEQDGRTWSVELPSWMLDRVACAGMELQNEPRVGCAHLRSLRELLRSVTPRDVRMDRHPCSSIPGDADEDSTPSLAGSRRSVSAATHTASVEEPAAGDAKPNPGAADSTAAGKQKRPRRRSSRKGGRS